MKCRMFRPSPSWMLLILMVSASLGACKPAPESADESAQNSPTTDDEQEAAEIPADEIPTDQTMSGPTKTDKFHLVATPTPNPIPFQQLFELKVEIFQDADHKEPAEDTILDQVRTQMPAHRHGMKNEPEIESLGNGKFLVKGMRFHMQGEGDDGHWTLEYIIRDGATIDTALFDLQCCHE